uniref:Uncharacterized protein n=1 Tax=Ixodes ricinus TaxID=34613 RepID=A0A6B0URL0_IXORI
MKCTSHNRELEVGFHLLALFVLASRILCLLRFSFPSGNRHILNPFFSRCSTTQRHYSTPLRFLLTSRRAQNEHFHRRLSLHASGAAAGSRRQGTSWRTTKLGTRCAQLPDCLISVARLAAGSIDRRTLPV